MREFPDLRFEELTREDLKAMAAGPVAHIQPSTRATIFAEWLKYLRCRTDVVPPEAWKSVSTNTNVAPLAVSDPSHLWTPKEVLQLI